MRKAYVVSTFDMLNVQDLDLIDQVKGVSDEVVVAVLGDDEVTRLHGRPPVVPEQERLGLVQALRDMGETVLCESVDELPADGAVYTDEQGLATKADVLLLARRKSSSPELLRALAYGSTSTTMRNAV